MSFVSTNFHAPRLTDAQFDSLEEAVERELAAIRSARAATPLPREPRAGASWPRRAVRAVVRVWHEAAEREAGFDAERDEVRRRLLMDQPRLW
ncbi:hypothetical protein GCM10027449_08920 [Sinomonas notoginsengisoli]|uniref:hypothetical protein n=1 Tax=Sinomonas notoginsengisoli TaxID=1457311 RepID=UPI001F236CA5|nr:hypothetical protein [Sinomonas notoginsengisoli]